MGIKLFTVPNVITCLNLLSGCMAIIAALRGNFELAFYYVIAGAVFDFLDGLAARLTKSYSAVGVQLDSLADMITFGVAPAVVMFSILETTNSGSIYNYLMLLIAVFAALRLAKFNVDTRQHDTFIGLPTPANALFFASIGWIFSHHGTFHVDTWVAVVMVLAMSFFMISEVPMFSLKLKNLSWRDNKVTFLFLGLSIIALIFFWLAAVPSIIIGYIVLSLVKMCYLRSADKVQPES